MMVSYVFSFLQWLFRTLRRGARGLGVGLADDRGQDDEDIFMGQMIGHANLVERVMRCRLLGIIGHFGRGARRVKSNAEAHVGFLAFGLMSSTTARSRSFRIYVFDWTSSGNPSPDRSSKLYSRPLQCLRA